MTRLTSKALREIKQLQLQCPAFFLAIPSPPTGPPCDRSKPPASESPCAPPVYAAVVGGCRPPRGLGVHSVESVWALRWLPPCVASCCQCPNTRGKSHLCGPVYLSFPGTTSPGTCQNPPKPLPDPPSETKDSSWVRGGPKAISLLLSSRMRHSLVPKWHHAPAWAQPKAASRWKLI